MRDNRDNRLYKNSDEQPKKGDKIINCGTEYEVKGVSKCGHKLFIKGWAMTQYANTGCSNLASEPICQLGESNPEWFSKKFN